MKQKIIEMLAAMYLQRFGNLMFEAKTVEANDSDIEVETSKNGEFIAVRLKGNPLFDQFSPRLEETTSDKQEGV